MSIKIALLKSGESVIADMQEKVYVDNKITCYTFKNPYTVTLAPIELDNQFLTEEEFSAKESSTDDPNKIEVLFNPWPGLTMDTEVIVRPDWVVTIVTPAAEILKLYEEMIDG